MQYKLNPIALRRLILALTIAVLSVILVAVILGKIQRAVINNPFMGSLQRV